jgi:hypothetical protein
MILPFCWIVQEGRLSTSAAAQQFTPDVYVWSFPGCPLRVHFSIPLIERLAAELKRTGDAETGGLLIGNCEGAVTHVVDFRPVSCDSLGSAYLPLTSAAKSRFGEIISQTGSMAIGYYRIQNRGINQRRPVPDQSLFHQTRKRTLGAGTHR